MCIVYSFVYIYRVWTAHYQNVKKATGVGGHKNKKKQGVQSKI